MKQSKIYTTKITFTNGKSSEFSSEAENLDSFLKEVRKQKNDGYPPVAWNIPTISEKPRTIEDVRAEREELSKRVQELNDEEESLTESEAVNEEE